MDKHTLLSKEVFDFTSFGETASFDEEALLVQIMRELARYKQSQGGPSNVMPCLYVGSDIYLKLKTIISKHMHYYDVRVVEGESNPRLHFTGLAVYQVDAIDYLRIAG